jgi:K+/H+ antiporter YhaU regulatory subunit KhtT
LPGACTVKMKIIQEMIQIERPMNWNREKLETIIKELIKIEKYNANVTRSIGKFKIKWNSLENVLNQY